MTFQSIQRVLVLAALAVLLVLVLTKESVLRGWEAVIASTVVSVSAATETGANPFLAIVSFNRETGHPTGLQITPECTSAFLMVPLVIVTGLLIWLRRQGSFWPLLGLAVASLLLLATNQVRIVAVVLLIKGMGFSSGYYWGHTIVGSVISIFGIGLSLISYALLAIRSGRGRTAA
ncbi:hypothetical protein Aph01nite_15780 [Acrocarpospora phusangensis]|uniref:Exosortase/archaeosortase family protein n=1 Tax=Acrocarpospora phusangensis TaxID=1070424 RepID=A0A919UMG2_9ACTN|nr:hypothetical protein [Acrocarpospora phusangensis]GIH23268.1 hypothetical protein Aph01nite_15780 [Acrocarpospora phusangensis]